MEKFNKNAGVSSQEIALMKKMLLDNSRLIEEMKNQSHFVQNYSGKTRLEELPDIEEGIVSDKSTGINVIVTGTWQYDSDKKYWYNTDIRSTDKAGTSFKFLSIDPIVSPSTPLPEGYEWVADRRSDGYIYLVAKDDVGTTAPVIAGYAMATVRYQETTPIQNGAVYLIGETVASSTPYIAHITGLEKYWEKYTGYFR